MDFYLWQQTAFDEEEGEMFWIASFADGFTAHLLMKQNLFFLCCNLSNKYFHKMNGIYPLRWTAFHQMIDIGTDQQHLFTG